MALGIRSSSPGTQEATRVLHLMAVETLGPVAMVVPRDRDARAAVKVC